MTEPDSVPSDPVLSDSVLSDSVLTERLVRFRPSLFLASLAAGLLGAVFIYSWGYQIKNDIGVAGINRPVFWGFYITNFVFWIGISHAGTLISAILRVTGAEWRRPITRCAEAITAFALAIGGLFPIIHLGRPEKLLYMLPLPNDRGLWPNFRSPLIWDLAAITAYVLGSVLYLYLPMIPDMAILRDRSSGGKRLFYSILALGWRGTPRQWSSLESGIKVMAIIIIPLAVSVHTIVSWDFAMTQAPMWNSTIFGPYFVVGAIYSGIAMLMIAMALLRRSMQLQSWLSLPVFNNLSLLFMAMAMFWGYFTFAEHLTVFYANETGEARVFWERATGQFSGPFWTMMVCNFVIPMAVLPFRWGRRPVPAALVGVSVVIGMWLERFLIVVPTLSLPRLAYTIGEYSPSWVELGIAFGSLGAFVFLYLAFAQLAPIISIWEIREGRSQDEPSGEVSAEGTQASSVNLQDAKVVYAAYDGNYALSEALSHLEDDDLLEIRTSVPPEIDDPRAHHKSRVPIYAILGGTLGGALVYSLAVTTSHAFPLYTGQMSLTPALPIGVVTYEGIALGAVLGTFLSTLFEGGVLRRFRSTPLGRHVSDGRAVLAIDCSDGLALERISAALDGAVEVTT